MPKFVDVSNMSIPLDLMKQYLNVPADQQIFTVIKGETVYCDHETFVQMKEKYKKEISFEILTPSKNKVYHDGLNRQQRRARAAQKGKKK